MMPSAEERLSRVFESLDGMGAQIYESYVNGNKSDARLMFRSCPAERQGYLAFTIVGLHTSIGKNNRPVELEEFFRSVTD